VVLRRIVYARFKSSISFEERGMIEQTILLISTSLVYIDFKSSICFEERGMIEQIILLILTCPVYIGSKVMPYVLKNGQNRANNAADIDKPF